MFGRAAREERRGSYARIKMRGDRGHPCLTPRRMSIQKGVLLLKEGATLTSRREDLMKRRIQVGRPILERTLRAHS